MMRPHPPGKKCVRRQIVVIVIQIVVCALKCVQFVFTDAFVHKEGGSQVMYTDYPLEIHYTRNLLIGQTCEF